MNPLAFTQQFLRHPAQTGAVAPSSNSLADLITDAADLENASVVVEWGPGGGMNAVAFHKGVILEYNCVIPGLR